MGDLSKKSAKMSGSAGTIREMKGKIRGKFAELFANFLDDEECPGFRTVIRIKAYTSIQMAVFSGRINNCPSFGQAV